MALSEFNESKTKRLQNSSNIIKFIETKILPMAISKNPFLKGFSGHIDKTIVVKQYPGDRTIITAYPDMSNVKPSKAQLVAKADFAEAVAYAKEIINNTTKKSTANTRLANRKGTLYHALIAEYMSNIKLQK